MLSSRKEVVGSNPITVRQIKVNRPMKSIDPTKIIKSIYLFKFFGGKQIYSHRLTLQECEDIISNHHEGKSTELEKCLISMAKIYVKDK